MRGRFFTSFDEAWSDFLGRSEPLEPFFEQFPEDDAAELEGWLFEPSEEVRGAALAAQERLADLDALVPVPEHFLHVWIAPVTLAGSAPLRWPRIAPFDVDVSALTCFHTAVVAEVHGPVELLLEGTAVARSTFLPHVTLACVRAPHEPDALREELETLRRLRLGRMRVREVERVRFPAARTTVMQPWSVRETVELAG